MIHRRAFADILAHDKQLGYAMKQQDSQRQTTTTVTELSKIRGQRSSLVTLSQKHEYLVAKFEDFHPSCWWMGVFLSAENKICR